MDDHKPSMDSHFHVWRNEVEVTRDEGHRPGRSNVRVKAGGIAAVFYFTSPAAEAAFFDAVQAARPSLEVIAAEAVA